MNLRVSSFIYLFIFFFFLSNNKSHKTQMRYPIVLKFGTQQDGVITHRGI